MGLTGAYAVIAGITFLFGALNVFGLTIDALGPRTRRALGLGAGAALTLLFFSYLGCCLIAAIWSLISAI